MKKVKDLLNQNYRYLLLAIMILGIASCSNDNDNGTDQNTTATGSMVVNDQTISQNKIMVQTVTTDKDGWLVARNASGNTTSVVSDTVQVSAGTTQNVELTLNDSANFSGTDAGDQITITLYQDNQGNGTQGQYDSQDTPVNDNSGNVVQKTITVRAPGYKVQDQTITDNAVNFDSVNTRDGGFIVLYNQNADGTMNQSDIVGQSYVNAGDTGAMSVPFTDGFTYTSGQNIYPVLYTDNPADQQFTYPSDNTTDTPETYGYDTTGNQQPVGSNPIMVQ